ncbi:MAG TPA: hypothetical protein ENJ82_09735, partial [Bacteroidetes bacterium]|nr:hypothetical protein [Bacteroidota bacterium]
YAYGNPEGKAYIFPESGGGGGKKNGWVKNYFEDGKVRSEKEYEGGMVNGKVKIYHRSGALKLEGEMERNQKTGMWKESDEKGNLVMEYVYHNGTLTGPFTVYLPGEKVSAIGKFSNGLVNGKVEVFKANGHLAHMLLFSEGKSIDNKNDWSWFPSGLSLKVEDVSKQ